MKTDADILHIMLNVKLWAIMILICLIAIVFSLALDKMEKQNQRLEEKIDKIINTRP